MIDREKYSGMRPNKAKNTFENLEYPITTDELVAEVGDVGVTLQIGTETISDVFERVGAETYSEPEEAYLTFLSALSTKAIGRKGYSDRDPPVGSTGDPLLSDDPRFDSNEPNCGVCEHVEITGDWDAITYCERHDRIVEPISEGVCSDFVKTT